MADSVQVAAFEGGQLRLLSPGGDSGEAVLALPLSRLVIRVVKVPAESREDPAAFAASILQTLNPYTDETLTVSCETVRETPEELVVIAAAMPEGAADDVAEALDGKNLNVTRVDALALGQLRGLWNEIGLSAGMRKLVVIRSADCLSCFVLDEDGPVAIRAVDAAAELRRELMLLLLEAEDFGGPRPLAGVVVVGSGEGDDGALGEALSSFGPVRTLAIGEDAGLVGVAERTLDPVSLNALPASWAEMLAETRFRKKLVKNLSVAGGIWALLMAVIFGVPAVFGYMTDRQKELSKEHSRQWTAVNEVKQKVELVQKYSDHDRGALEIMKCLSDRLPEGIELESWTFRRESAPEDFVTVRVSGLSDDKESVYAFKDRVDAAGTVTEGSGDGDGETAEGEPVFPSVVMSGPAAGKNGRQKFDLEASTRKEEEE